MPSDLLPNFLPRRPHSFWVFLRVLISIFLASFALKTLSTAQNISAHWHQENPVALVDLSACSGLSLKTLKTNFPKHFSTWHLTSIKGKSFQAPATLNEKIDFFFALSPKTEKGQTLSLLPSIEKFFVQTCPKASFASLPETEQQEINAKTRHLEEKATQISYALGLTSLFLFLFSLVILIKARFQLSLPRLILLTESHLSAFRISVQTIRSLSLAVCFGLFSGIILANLFCAYFSAHFFQKSFFDVFFYTLKKHVWAVQSFSLTPDLLLILVALSLYGAIILFFLWNLRKKLQKRRQVRIFLSNHNSFD